MSLKHAAKHLAAQGRGPDKNLVHMSPREVAGLQSLALAHGGSLTINPETGLPEAGFLDSLLPAVLGAGAMMIPGMQPWGAAALVGGLQTARTGDLGKGIMAGLGAYGGAGALNGVAGLGEAGSGFAGDTMASNVSGGLDMAVANPSAGLAAAGGKNIAMAASPAIMDAMQPDAQTPQETRDQMIRPYTFTYNSQTPTNMIGAQYQQGQDTSERTWMQPEYTALEPYKAAQGGLMSFAGGGMPVEQMSNANGMGMNTGYPMADINQGAYATPWQTPISRNVVAGAADTGVNPMNGEMSFAAGGGISDLGGYSDYAKGGRMLKGPGDGMSDSIPAVIGAKQPARLAKDEFVVPADVVSHLGNGSSDAGAKQLYAMMDRVRQKRTGKKRQAPEMDAQKVMPA